jgi:hypothetical protein
VPERPSLQIGPRVRTLSHEDRAGRPEDDLTSLTTSLAVLRFYGFESLLRCETRGMRRVRIQLSAWSSGGLDLHQGMIS